MITGELGVARGRLPAEVQGRLMTGGNSFLFAHFLIVPVPKISDFIFVLQMVDLFS